MKLVIFTQTFCGPCKQLKPALKATADELGLELEEWSVDDNWSLCQEYGVTKTPTVFFMDDDNNIVKRIDWSNVVQVIKEVKS